MQFIQSRDMSMFDIESYLNSLPDDVTNIYLIGKNIYYIPSLSRFTQLRLLDCSDNHITTLPQLNKSLELLYCNNNRLTSLPCLNKNLTTLYCDNNIYLIKTYFFIKK